MGDHTFVMFTAVCSAEPEVRSPQSRLLLCEADYLAMEAAAARERAGRSPRRDRRPEREEITTCLRSREPTHGPD